ncbi:MAG: hypothetical protein JO227_06075, partial [Acetobacteraceae bacterium]|nr:hypothetical protein [Acetobacteraceae bacterium]
EATRLLRRGLGPLEKLPPTRAVLEQRLALSSLLGPALIAVKGPGAAETQDLYNNAYSLSQDLPEDSAHFPIYWGWWRLSRDFQVKQQRAQTLLIRARRRADPELLLQAHHCNWANCYASAQFDECRTHISAGLALYQQGDYRHHARLYGNHDAKVCAHGEMAQLEWIQGRPLSALQQEAQSRAWAETIDHLGSRVHAMDMRLLHRAYRREHEHVFALSGEMASFASEHALADHRVKALIFRGWTVALQGDPVAGLRILQEGMEAQTDIGTTEDLAVYLCLLAEAFKAAGQADKAVETLAREKAAFESFGYRIFMPELLRVLARMMLSADPRATEPARAALEEARVMAEQQHAAMLGLRIAVTRARLDQADRPEEALRRLELALARVTEDDGGIDLTTARQLVGELRRRTGNPRLVTGG